MPVDFNVCGECHNTKEELRKKEQLFLTIKKKIFKTDKLLELYAAARNKLVKTESTVQELTSKLVTLETTHREEQARTKSSLSELRTLKARVALLNKQKVKLCDLQKELDVCRSFEANYRRYKESNAVLEAKVEFWHSQAIELEAKLTVGHTKVDCKSKSTQADIDGGEHIKLHYVKDSKAEELEKEVERLRNEAELADKKRKELENLLLTKELELSCRTLGSQEKSNKLTSKEVDCSRTFKLKWKSSESQLRAANTEIAKLKARQDNTSALVKRLKKLEAENSTLRADLQSVPAPDIVDFSCPLSCSSGISSCNTNDLEQDVEDLEVKPAVTLEGALRDCCETEVVDSLEKVVVQSLREDVIEPSRDDITQKTTENSTTLESTRAEDTLATLEIGVVSNTQLGFTVGTWVPPATRSRTECSDDEVMKILESFKMPKLLSPISAERVTRARTGDNTGEGSELRPVLEGPPNAWGRVKRETRRPGYHPYAPRPSRGPLPVEAISLMQSLVDSVSSGEVSGTEAKTAVITDVSKSLWQLTRFFCADTDVEGPSQARLALAPDVPGPSLARLALAPKEESLEGPDATPFQNPPIRSSPPLRRPGVPSVGTGCDLGPAVEPGPWGNWDEARVSLEDQLALSGPSLRRPGVPSVGTGCDLGPAVEPGPWGNWDEARVSLEDQLALSGPSLRRPGVPSVGAGCDLGPAVEPGPGGNRDEARVSLEDQLALSDSEDESYGEMQSYETPVSAGLENQARRTQFPNVHGTVDKSCGRNSARSYPTTILAGATEFTSRAKVHNVPPTIVPVTQEEISSVVPVMKRVETSAVAMQRKTSFVVPTRAQEKTPSLALPMHGEPSSEVPAITQVESSSVVPATKQVAKSAVVPTRQEEESLKVPAITQVESSSVVPATKRVAKSAVVPTRQEEESSEVPAITQGESLSVVPATKRVAKSAVVPTRQEEEEQESSSEVPAITQGESSSVVPAMKRVAKSAVVPTRQEKKESSSEVPAITQGESSSVVPAKKQVLKSAVVLTRQEEKESSSEVPAITQGESSSVVPAKKQVLKSAVVPTRQEEEEESSSVVPAITQGESFSVVPVKKRVAKSAVVPTRQEEESSKVPAITQVESSSVVPATIRVAKNAVVPTRQEEESSKVPAITQVESSSVVPATKQVLKSAVVLTRQEEKESSSEVPAITQGESSSVVPAKKQVLKSAVVPTRQEEESSKVPAITQVESSSVVPATKRVAKSAVVPTWQEEEESSLVVPAITQVESSSVVPATERVAKSAVVPTRQRKEDSSSVVPAITQGESSSVVPVTKQVQKSAVVPTRQEETSAVVPATKQVLKSAVVPTRQEESSSVVPATKQVLKSAVVPTRQEETSAVVPAITQGESSGVVLATTEAQENISDELTSYSTQAGVQLTLLSETEQGTPSVDRSTLSDARKEAERDGLTEMREEDSALRIQTSRVSTVEPVLVSRGSHVGQKRDETSRKNASSLGAGTATGFSGGLGGKRKPFLSLFKSFVKSSDVSPNVSPESRGNGPKKWMPNHAASPRLGEEEVEVSAEKPACAAGGEKGEGSELSSLESESADECDGNAETPEDHETECVARVDRMTHSRKARRMARTKPCRPPLSKWAAKRRRSAHSSRSKGLVDGTEESHLENGNASRVPSRPQSPITVSEAQTRRSPRLLGQSVTDSSRTTLQLSPRTCSSEPDLPPPSETDRSSLAARPRPHVAVADLDSVLAGPRVQSSNPPPPRTPVLHTDLGRLLAGPRAQSSNPPPPRPPVLHTIVRKRPITLSDSVSTSPAKKQQRPSDETPPPTGKKYYSQEASHEETQLPLKAVECERLSPEGGQQPSKSVECQRLSPEGGQQPSKSVECQRLSPEGGQQPSESLECQRLSPEGGQQPSESYECQRLSPEGGQQPSESVECQRLSPEGGEPPLQLMRTAYEAYLVRRPDSVRTEPSTNGTKKSRALTKRTVERMVELDRYHLLDPKGETVLTQIVTDLANVPSAVIVQQLLTLIAEDEAAEDTEFSPPAPPLSPSQRHVVTLAWALQYQRDSIVAELCSQLKTRVLRLGTTPDLKLLVRYTRVLATLCIAKRDVKQLRTFLYDLLYCFMYKCYQLFHVIVMMVPGVFPRAEEARDDILVHTIVYLLLSPRPDAHRRLHVDHSQLKGLMETRYNYNEANRLRLDQIMTMIDVNLKAGRLRGIEPAVTLLAKRISHRWTHENLVVPYFRLLPSKTADARLPVSSTVLVVKLLGHIARTIPKHETTQYRTVMNKMAELLTIGEPDIEESAAMALLGMSAWGHHYTDIARWLYRWQPRRRPTEELVSRAVVFMNEQPPPYWRQYLAKYDQAV